MSAALAWPADGCVADAAPVPGDVVAAATGADGWAHSQKVGNAATAADRSFKVKKYASNMKALLSSVPGLELKKVGTETNVRLKP